MTTEIKTILEKLVIPNINNIKGNITLLDRLDNAEITWKSSNEKIVSDRDDGSLKKGVVNRQPTDTKVTLTATVDFNGEKEEKVFELNVVKAPKQLTDEDFTGYLFGHFIGEEDENSEQIYFAISNGGLVFKDANSCKPVLVSNLGEKGVRDPFLYRSKEGDRFFLIATDLSIYGRGGWFQNEQGYYDASTTGSQYLVLWESDDLVNWSEPRLIDAAPENAGMAWAPEMIYNDETGEYIIFFASSIMNPETKYKSKPNAIYYVATRDFVNYSEPQIFIDNQTDNIDGSVPREIIDTTVLKIGDYYYSVSKDGDNFEKNGGIRILKTKTLLDKDSWEKVLDMDELSVSLDNQKIDVLDNSTLEGPELFRKNKCEWSSLDKPEYCIIADQYFVGEGYLPIVTTDIEDKSGKAWKVLGKGEYSFDKLKKRHGTVLNITKDEYDRLNFTFF